MRPDRPDTPCEISVHRMAARQASPVRVAIERQRQECAVLDFAQQASIHATAPVRRSSLRSIACAAAITVKVIKNSNRPSAMSEEV